MTNEIEKAIEIYLSKKFSKTKTAKEVAKELGIPYDNALRRRIARKLEAIDKSEFMDECEKVGIDPLNVKHYWYKGKLTNVNISRTKHHAVTFTTMTPLNLRILRTPLRYLCNKVLPKVLIPKLITFTLYIN